MNQLDTYIAVERDGRFELVSLTKCSWRLSVEHLLEQCLERYDFFPLNGNDEAFLDAVGIF